MPAEYQRNGGHYQQCQHLQADAVRANKYNQQQEGNDQSRQVHFVTVWQHQRFRRNLATQFAERHHRTRKRYRPDEDTEEHFRQVNIDQNRCHSRVMMQIAVKANQHCRQTHEAMQDRHQFWHFGHFNFLRQTDTNCPTNNHRQQDPANITRIRSKNGCD